MTPIFFHHILAIDIFRISQDKSVFEKRVLNQACGFFQHFLALFETFTTLYNDPHIKLSSLANFDLQKPVLKKRFLKMY